MNMRYFLLTLTLAASSSYGQSMKACIGQHGPIIGCSSDSRHFPCYTSPDAVAQSMCGGAGQAKVTSIHKGHKCGYHYLDVTCNAGMSTNASPSATAKTAQGSVVTATGYVKCVHRESGASEGTVQSTGQNSNGDCSQARKAVIEYLNGADRCYNDGSATRTWRQRSDKQIYWLQTNTCSAN